jgi:hypothetical protein
MPRFDHHRRASALTKYDVFLPHLLHIYIGMVLATLYRDRLKKDTSLSSGSHRYWSPSRAESGEGRREDGRRKPLTPSTFALVGSRIQAYTPQE